RTQQDQIKLLIKQGDLLGAQRVILDELESRFAGVARALARTPTGKLLQLFNIVGDIGERVGISFTQGIEDAFGSIANGAKAIGVVLSGIGRAVARLVSLVVRNIEQTISAFLPDISFDVIVENVNLAVDLIFNRIELFVNAIKGIIAEVVSSVLQGVQQMVRALGLITGQETGQTLTFLGKVSEGLKKIADQSRKDADRIEKDFQKIIAAFGLEAAKKALDDFLEALGLVKREKPELKITFPKLPKEIKVKLIVESPEDVLGRIQAEVNKDVKKQGDEQIKIQQDLRDQGKRDAAVDKARNTLLGNISDGIDKVVDNLTGALGLAGGRQR
ncbi:hypothetical protein LCGC14_2554200, partial [marine sediment metagenome]